MSLFPFLCFIQFNNYFYSLLCLLFGFHLNRFVAVNHSSFLRNCDVNLNISTSRSTVLFTIYLPYSFKLISPIFTFDYSINFSPHEYLQLIIVSYIFYLCFEIYEITFFIIGYTLVLFWHITVGWVLFGFTPYASQGNLTATYCMVPLNI